MALTTLVKDELASYDAPKISARKAEISTILRFTGGLHIVSGRIVVESEVDHEPTAHRMRRTISEIYGHDSELTSVTGGGLRRGGRYVVRVDQGGEALARQTGLLDVRGRPVRGLPPAVVNGSLQDAEAVMRGAFLAHGSLTERTGVYLPRPRGRPGSRGCRPSPRHHCEGPRGARYRPRGGA